MGILIRSVELNNSEEFESVFKLHIEFLTSLASIRNDIVKLPKNVDVERDLFMDKIKHKGTYCLVSFDKNRIVGYALSFPCRALDPDHYVERTYSFLDEIYVRPNYRNRGVASSFIQNSKNHFKSHGYNKYELYVLNKNYISVELYKKNGFSVQSMIMECEL